MFISEILLLLFSCLFYTFYRMRKQQISLFKRLGVPGPEPNFLFGNLLDFRKTPLYRKQQEWKQEYGETYGYFEGPTPVLVTSNVSVLQEVFVKQFHKFHARKLWPVQVDPDKDEDVHMFFARGKRWKRLRRVVNPAFSSSKIRKMSPTVNECTNHLLDVIKNNANVATNKTVELLSLFRRLTLDTILRCEVGLDQNSLKNPDDLFLKHCKGVIEDTTNMPWLYLLGFMFPGLHCVWINIYKFLHNLKFNPVFWLEDRMREVIIIRRDNKDNKRSDLMQQMLDAQFFLDSVHDLENEESKLHSPYKKTLKSMTNEEIVSHALLFLLAGFETTSTTLAYIFFELSHNPQVQQRLRHEVMTVLPRGYNEIKYDDLKNLTYLDFVIWETLRKYPLASTVTARQCMEDCTIGDLKIPKGVLIHANIWAVHYDPKHWGDNPDRFDPLRFMPEKRKERHPSAWMPFGGGPRSCAGLRFALLQLKMVVAKVLRDFDFHPSIDQCAPLNLVQGATILPADGVRLAAMRRGSAMSEAGLRRGSAMAGVPLSEWLKIKQRPVHDDEESTSDSSDVSVKLESHRQRWKRRGSVADDESLGNGPKTRNSGIDRRSSGCSILEEALVEEGKAAVHQASIAQGIGFLAVDSVRKGASLLRRVSLNDGQESSVGQEDDQELDETKMSQSLSEDDDEPDYDVSVSTMPDDILGKMPQLMSGKVTRRFSALPELQSVREGGIPEDLKSWHSQLSFGDSMGLTEDIDLKNRKPLTGSRLYQRRGSG